MDGGKASDRARGYRSAELKVELTGLGVLLAVWRQKLLAFRANFDPNQPRVPPGSGRTSGRWRKVEGRRPQGDARKPLIIDIPARRTPADEPARPLSKTRRLRLPTPGTSTSDRPPLGPFPRIPDGEPPTFRERIAVVRAVTRFAARALLGGMAGPLGLLVNAARVASWFYEYYSWVEAYFDPPKTLAELRRNAALGRADGYDIHHIVERTPAAADGFPDGMIDGPDNLVRIPRLKHWELNAWFEQPRRRYGGLTPRQYVRGEAGKSASRWD